MLPLPKTTTLAALARLSAIVLGGPFLAAAVPKMLNAQAFAQDISNYQLMPEWSIGPLARVLPAVEVVVAAALLAGIYQAGAALLSLGMLTAFTVSIVQALVRGIDLDCGCFGDAAASPISMWSLVRNIALICLSVLVLIGHPSRWPWSSKTTDFKTDA